MKDIVIAKNGVKRTLRFPFEICSDRESLLWLRDMLQQAYNNEWSYGWITVPEKAEDQGMPNTKPLEWDG